VNPIRAIAQYNAKLVPANVSAYLTAQLVPVMQPAYADSAVSAFALEGQVKGILALITVPAPIPTTDFVMYYAFARKITRIKRRFAGPQLAAEAGYLVTTFTARGLNAAALASIVAVLI
jgi:hypothetical protein